MRRALVGCGAFAVSAAPIGVFLTLRRMSMSGDVLAHAVLPGAAAGYLIAGLSAGAMTLGGIIAGLTVALLSGWVARATIVPEDSSMAAFYAISLSLGVLLVSAGGANLDLLHILFGNALTIDNPRLLFIASISSVTMVGIAIIYRPLVVECLDSAFLRCVSSFSPIAHYGFLALTVLSLVSGLHVLGALMAVGIMILPATAARFWTRNMTGTFIIATASAFLSTVAGLLLSFYTSLPSGPSIIITAGGFYLFSLILGPEGALVKKIRPHTHLKA